MNELNKTDNALYKVTIMAKTTASILFFIMILLFTISCLLHRNSQPTIPANINSGQSDECRQIDVRIPDSNEPNSGYWYSMPVGGEVWIDGWLRHTVVAKQ